MQGELYPLYACFGIHELKCAKKSKMSLSRKGMDVVFIEEAHLQMKAASRTGKITKYKKSRAVTYV